MLLTAVALRHCAGSPSGGSVPSHAKLLWLCGGEHVASLADGPAWLQSRDASVLILLRGAGITGKVSWQERC